MVRHCAVEDCGNLLIRCGKPIHQFPKDEQLRALWIRLARPSSPAWLPTTSDRLCSYHFRDEDYVRSPRVMESLGFPVRKVQLKPGVLPRLFSKKRRSGERSEPLDKRRRVAPLRDSTNFLVGGADTCWEPTNELEETAEKK
ncbi:THAP domain-containing protein 11-like [Ixodes scapularis]|uniref:THAP domain-containing protein 11-like n=1 Tax=Ixodes scapularis TaxID=6945 RepID=UPI001AA009C7|nr:THAP domain-containing protein 11-like [Ixodes scapularis]